MDRTAAVRRVFSLQVITGMLGILLLSTALWAEESPGASKRFGLNITAGAEQSYWDINRPNECQGCPVSVVDYETEGLGLYRVDATLLFRDQSLLKLHYEAPLSSSERQKEILVVNQTSSAGAEVFGLDLALDAYAQRWFPEQSRAHYALRAVTSLKFTATRELFWGQAKAREDATFIPIDQVIDYTVPLPNNIPVPAGQPLSFSTEFTNRELTMAVLRFGGKDTPLPDSAIRVGWFNSEWQRLTDARLAPLSPLPVIFEAKFKSQGIVIAAENRDPGAPGLNFEAAMKWGIVNDLESAIDWKKLYGEDIRVETNMISGGAWYNWYFDKSSRQGWAIRAGASFDFRNTKVQLNPGAFSADTVAGFSDLIYRLYASLGCQF